MISYWHYLELFAVSMLDAHCETWDLPRTGLLLPGRPQVGSRKNIRESVAVHFCWLLTMMISLFFLGWYLNHWSAQWCSALWTMVLSFVSMFYSVYFGTLMYTIITPITSLTRLSLYGSKPILVIIKGQFWDYPCPWTPGYPKKIPNHLKKNRDILNHYFPSYYWLPYIFLLLPWKKPGYHRLPIGYPNKIPGYHWLP